MLIVRRRAGEAILVGPDVEIEIVEIGVNRVKLAIRAPRGISVQRKEAVLVERQNLQAALLPTGLHLSLAERLPELFTRNLTLNTDKTFEARYSGHPDNKENLEPA